MTSRKRLAFLVTSLSNYNMKRVLKPTGSRSFSSSKRTRRTPQPVVVVPRQRRRSFGMNGTSLFQPNVTGPEKKNIDTFTSAYWTTASGAFTITPLNLIAQGTTSTSHIGRKAVMTSVLCRGWLGLSAGTFPVRIVLVYDKETNGATAAASDIFAISDSLSPMNLANTDRFIVVGECQPMVNTQQTNPGVCHWEIFRKMSLPIAFNDNTNANIAAINAGSLLLCTCLGDNTSTISLQETFTRVRFIDN